MDQNNSTHDALDAGVKEILRELAACTSERTNALIAQCQGNRLVGFHQGLRELRSKLPEYEERLITLHLDLGVADAAAIGDLIAVGIRGVVGGLGRSLVSTCRGQARPAALRDAQHFEAEVGGYLSGTAGRALVAVEQHRRRNAVTIKYVEKSELSQAARYTLSELLRLNEQPWLDWKEDFPPGVTGGKKHAQRDEHRGKLLKTIGAIANSIVDTCGYLIYGVRDKDNRRTVVGTPAHLDDAELQGWNADIFDPPVRFDCREEERDEKRVAIFEIHPSSEYPHVCKAAVGEELHKGQVWFRRGSRNTLAGFADLKRMFAPPEPLRTDQPNGALARQVQAFWQGWEFDWIGPDMRDERLAQGYRIAFAPESRREVRWAQLNKDVGVLMLRPKK